MTNLQTIHEFQDDVPGALRASAGNAPLHTDPFAKPGGSYTEAAATVQLSIALVGCDGHRRNAVESALSASHPENLRHLSHYPARMNSVQEIVEQNHDVIIVDLDNDPEYALQVVESICANSQATVMVFSDSRDQGLLVRCMRAGAREFLNLPFSAIAITEALARASVRRPMSQVSKTPMGRMLVFLGAKGGTGVTTVSCNVAVSLAKESGQSTLLIDLDLPLGDAVLNLGCVPEYSTIDALQDFNRLDASLLAKLVVKHSSGLAVLAAPGRLPIQTASDEAVDKLLAVARRNFDNVVIDMGSRLDLFGTTLFKDADVLYLVTQPSISDLRNSNRLISQVGSLAGSKLQIVINRYDPRSLSITDEQIRKALTRPFDWQVPNDYEAIRKMQSTAVPLALTDSNISRQIRKIARSICPQPEAPAKKKGFRLFG